MWALRKVVTSYAIEVLWFHRRHYLMWVVVPSQFRNGTQVQIDGGVEEIRRTVFERSRCDADHEWLVRQI